MGQGTQAGRGGGQQRHDFRADMLGGGLFVVGLGRPEKKQAVGGHFLDRLSALALCDHDLLQERIVVRLHAELLQMPAQRSDETHGWRVHHVLLVEPRKLFAIERRGGLVDVRYIEQPDHLLDAEYLLIAMGPAQTDQIVEDRLGQEALVAILQNAHGAVTLRELRAVGTQNHRKCA